MSGTVLWGAGVVIVVVVAAIVGIMLLSGSTAKSRHLIGDAYPNVDMANTRDVSGPIDADDVARLQQKWLLPVTAHGLYGTYASTPVISHGVVYSQDLASNVEAIRLSTGKILWSKSYNAPDHGPNGLVVADGRVFGTTPTAVFALSQDTGQQLWSATVVTSGEPTIDMAPGYDEGLVYVSTTPGQTNPPTSGEDSGTMFALNAETGKTVWKFDTVTPDVWSGGVSDVNWGGGAWYTPAFDGRGSMYFGIANPEPGTGTVSQPWGATRPGPDLYTDSIVKLNARTGRLEWYYQLTPHDVYDWDLQDPPILLGAGGREEVVTAGKAGTVLALAPTTGKVLWRRDVGKHNGHDYDSLAAMKHEYGKLKLPETVYPGRLGGVIAPMASDGASIFAPVVNLPQKISSQFEISEPANEASGEVVALSAATGAIQWTRHFTTPVYAGVTVANNVVFASTFEGTVYGLSASSGKILWQASLPAGTNAGVAVEGDTVVAPAGVAQASGQETGLVAYGLPSR